MISLLGLAMLQQSIAFVLPCARAASCRRYTRSGGPLMLPIGEPDQGFRASISRRLMKFSGRIKETEAEARLIAEARINAATADGESDATSRLLANVRGSDSRSKLKILLLDASRLYMDERFGEAAVIGRAALYARMQIPETKRGADITESDKKAAQEKQEEKRAMAQLVALLVSFAGLFVGGEVGDAMVYAWYLAPQGDAKREDLTMGPLTASEISNLPLGELWGALRAASIEYGIKHQVRFGLGFGFPILLWRKYERPFLRKALREVRVRENED